MFLPIAAVSLSLTAQYQEGALIEGGSCQSAIDGSFTPVVAADVGTLRDDQNALPKQGDVFYVFINVVSFSEPCLTRLLADVGVKLPPGVEFAPPATVNDPGVECYLGPSGNMQRVSCASEPTAELLDGTMTFAPAAGGLWSIPDTQVLQIDVPVRSLDVVNAPLLGYVDFANPGGFASPLVPQVAQSVFLYEPSVGYPTPSVDEITATSAHLFGFVDGHYNGGTIRLQLTPAGGVLTTVDTGELPDGAFENDIDDPMTGLLPSTDYEFRFTFQRSGTTDTTEGEVQRFRTLDAPASAPPPPASDPGTGSGGGIGTSPPADDGSNNGNDGAPGFGGGGGNGGNDGGGDDNSSAPVASDGGGGGNVPCYEDNTCHERRESYDAAGGCAATPAATCSGFALLLALIRRRRGR